MKFNSIKVVCLLGLVFFLFLFPYASRANPTEVFKTVEHTIILNGNYVETTYVYLYENYGHEDSAVDINFGICESQEPEEFIATDSYGESYDIIEIPETGKYCYGAEPRRITIKAGKSYFLEYSYKFKKMVGHEKIGKFLNLFDIWSYHNTIEIGKSDKVTEKVKIHQAYPHKIPIIIGRGILPQPDDIYEELEYRVFVWDIDEKEFSTNDRIVKYFNFEYFYFPDKNLIYWSLILIFIEVFLVEPIRELLNKITKKRKSLKYLLLVGLSTTVLILLWVLAILI